jgi:GPI-anchor transamidase subunit T
LNSTYAYQSGTVSPSNDNIKYGTLSRETVCTENLTPFKKLLATRGKDGLSSLLNPLELYKNFHSMGLFFEKKKEKDGRIRYELIQTISTIFDLKYLMNINDIYYNDWRLSKIFKRNLEKKSSISSKSKIYIINEYFDEKDFEIKQKFLKEKNVYEVIEYENDIEMKWLNKKKINNRYRSLSKIKAHRYVTNENRIELIIKNQAKEEVKLRYYDLIPSQFIIHFHTIKIFLNHEEMELKFLKNLKMIPSNEKSPSLVEFEIVLPINSSFKYSFYFEKMFLKISDHPPDANRGFDISSSMIFFNDSNIIDNSFYFKKYFDSNSCYYTDSLLIMLPTPDFSMPYNVITLSSTVISLFIGSSINALTNRDK